MSFNVRREGKTQQLPAHPAVKPPSEKTQVGMALRSCPIFATKPPLSLPQNRKWPIPPILDQTRALWVLQNISRFIFETFLVAQPVLEIIPLPITTEDSRCPSFPVPYTFSHIRFRRKSKNKMNMVGHDAGGMDPPNPGGYPIQNRIP